MYKKRKVHQVDELLLFWKDGCNCGCNYWFIINDFFNLVKISGLVACYIGLVYTSKTVKLNIFNKKPDVTRELTSGFFVKEKGLIVQKDQCFVIVIQAGLVSGKIEQYPYHGSSF